MAFSYLGKWLEKQHICPIFWWNRLKKIVWCFKLWWNRSPKAFFLLFRRGTVLKKYFTNHSFAERPGKNVFRLILWQNDMRKMF
jgi:hypothetical protein